ncbi:MAG TPA: quinone oxidoreductase [Thermoanaerobaculaceae bacterium]|nr:quinone oxidoreductase [Thermoanaerobaculaceae bacterium]HPS77085.1 quinone oxidoreductase [Thermoanaerobaculaceae bacterium]
MARAIRFHEVGGPEVLQWEEVAVGAPGPGEARIRHKAIGLNFIDTYHRSGLYPLPLPSGLGSEAAGTVEEIGSAVTEVSVGQRVAYAGGPLGAYSEVRLIPADRLVPLPRDVDDRTAAAIMLKGMTAQYLLRSTFRVGPGYTVLIHAAAGGVGLLACQWAQYLGATVIGTVSTEAKAELAMAHGCHHVIVTAREDIVGRVKAITGGSGVHVVYDSVGRDTWDASLDCLRPRGLMVSFGNASGAVPPISPLVLSSKGSLFLTRPTLMSYTASREELLACAGELFEVVRQGVVKVRINQTYPLSDAATAHRDIQARRTTGSTVLLP